MCVRKRGDGEGLGEVQTSSSALNRKPERTSFSSRLPSAAGGCVPGLSGEGFTGTSSA